jgi:hypothetical protein
MWSTNLASLSDYTKQCLRRAGWYEGRRVPIGSIEELLAGKGFPTSKAIIEFISEFDGLTFQYRTATDTIQRCVIDVTANASLEDAVEMTTAYSDALQCPLCPIGTSYLNLFMSTRGDVYGCFDDYIEHIGTSGADALEAICTSRRPISSFMDVG